MAPPAGQGGQWLPLARDTRPEVRRIAIRTTAVVLALALAALAVALAWQLVPLPMSAVVADVARGSLQMRTGGNGPWVTARPGQLLHQGTRLKSSADSVVTVRFSDGSVMRIESQGNWVLRRSQGSRNGHVVRIEWLQEGGRASYVPAPLLGRLSGQLLVEVPGGSIDLAGVATLATSGQEVTHITILQGEARLVAAGQRLPLRSGQTAELAPQRTPVVLP